MFTNPSTEPSNDPSTGASNDPSTGASNRPSTRRRARLVAAGLAAATIATVGVAGAAASGRDDADPAAAPDAPTSAVHVPVTFPDLANVATDDAEVGTATPAASTDATDATGDPVVVPDGTAPASTQPVESDPATPQADIQDDGEALAPGPAGAVEGDELADAPPASPPPGTSTELEPVATSASPPYVPPPYELVTPPPAPDPIDDEATPVDPTPIDGPGGFQVTPLPGYLGELSSGLTGCQLECITSALLSAMPANADVGLDLVAKVPVHVEIELETAGDSIHLNNPGYDTEWHTVLSPLAPHTTYDLTLIAIDQEGHSKVYEHQFTTVDVVGGYTSGLEGCALTCLVSGTVDTTDDATAVQVHVATDVPAFLDLYVSTDPPAWDDHGVPSMPWSQRVHHDSGAMGADWTIGVHDLEPDTTYHVLAKAWDDHGTDHRVGTFHTDPAPPLQVRIAVEFIDVTFDGDENPSWNRGELSFGWGFDGVAIGTRSEDKMHEGSIVLHDHNFAWFIVDDPTDWLPSAGVRATERDGDGKIEFCTAGNGIPATPTYIDDCDAKSNVASTGLGVTVESIAALPSCASLGVAVPHPDARCKIIQSPDVGNDYPRFDAVVSFVVV